MNGMFKRIFSSIVSTAMVATALVGCTSSSSSSSSTSASSTPVSSGSASSSASTPASSSSATAGSVAYPVDSKGVVLSIARGPEPAVTANYKTLDETPFAQELMKQTGIKFVYEHPADSNAMNLMFASGTLPDIIYYNFGATYVGGPVKAIADKIIHPLDDLKEHIPDLMKRLEAEPAYMKGCLTPDKKLIGFPFVRDGEILLNSSGLVVREDWLKELKMEIPTTVEEFTTVAKAFKEQKNANLTLSVRFDNLKNLINSGIMTGYAGLPRGNWYVNDGKVEFGNYKPEFKGVLEMFAGLYKDGLLDTNFATIDAKTESANFMDGKSGFTYGALNGGIGNWMTTMIPKNPEFSATGCPPIVKAKGDKAMSGGGSYPVTGNYSVITESSKNKVLAAQLLNYGYTEKGHLLYNFGVEGVSYNLVDGKPVYSDEINKNPKGLTKQYAMAMYNRAWSSDAMFQDPEYIIQYAERPQQQAALKLWTETDFMKYVMPPVTVASADALEFSKAMGDINTYIDEMLIKFITGTEPMDKFDKYIETLKGMKMDRVIEIYQNAYNEFMSR